MPVPQRRPASLLSLASRIEGGAGILPGCRPQAYRASRTWRGQGRDPLRIMILRCPQPLIHPVPDRTNHAGFAKPVEPADSKRLRPAGDRRAPQGDQHLPGERRQGPALPRATSRLPVIEAGRAFDGFLPGGGAAGRVRNKPDGKFTYCFLRALGHNGLCQPAVCAASCCGGRWGERRGGKSLGGPVCGYRGQARNSPPHESRKA